MGLPYHLLQAKLIKCEKELLEKGNFIFSMGNLNMYSRTRECRADSRQYEGFQDKQTAQKEDR